MVEQQTNLGISDSWRRRRTASRAVPMAPKIVDIQPGPADGRRSRMAHQSQGTVKAVTTAKPAVAKTAVRQGSIHPSLVRDIRRPAVQKIERPQPAPLPVSVPVEVPQPVVALQEPVEVKLSFWSKVRVGLRPSHYSRPQLALFGMAGMIFVAGLVVSFSTFQTNHAVVTQVHALAAKTTAGGQTNAQVPPSETKPSVTRGYTVAPTLPKTLTIPKLKVNARVTQLGITKTGDLQAPTNIYDTGWYKASARPGDGPGSGAILIDGHVHGPTLPGVFMNIKKLVPGDTITVTRGDGQKFNYTVVKTQNYDAATIDMGMVLTSIQPGKAGLNLMTCGGPYDRQSGHYTQRTVVFAVQV